MKRLVGALAFLGATAAASSAMAQEIQIRGPLANAVSCRHCVEYRTGRVSLSPTFGMTLQDEYDRTMFVGLNAQYHFNEVIALGAWGAFGAIHIPTPLASQIQDRLSMGGSPSTPNIPDGSKFTQQVGQLNWILSVPQLTLVPLRGKLALFQNIFIDTDFYIFGGLGIIGLSERANFPENPGGTVGTTPDAGALAANQVARASRVAFTGTFGVGLNFYITHFLSLAVEYRAFPFSWNTMGTDENSTASTCGVHGTSSCAGFPDYAVPAQGSEGSYRGGGQFVLDANDRAFHWNQMVNFSLSFFLPTAPHISN
jgi:outer membrane beta-barrel protein